MSNMTEGLPQQFRQFERWLGWALATEPERYAKRAGSSLDELREFRDALTPHMHDIIRYLSTFEWGALLGPEDENLYRLGLSYMEAAVPLDLGWKRSVAEDSFPVERLHLAGCR